jgi:hypothetical protein
MNKYVKKVSLILFCLIFNQINGYQNQFRRLVLTDEKGNIIKYVDLVSDYHFTIQQGVLRGSKRQKKELTLSERSFMTSSDRAFLITVRELAKNSKHKSALLWEWNDEQFDRKRPVQEQSFIEYGARSLRDLGKDKSDKVVFIPSDTYRFNRLYFLSFLYPNDPYFQPALNEPFEKAMAFVSDQLDENSRALQAMNKIDNPTVKATLQELWQRYVDTKVRPFYQSYVEPLVTQGSTIDQVKKSGDFMSFARAFIQSVIPDTMNYELLTNIFSLPEKHIIIYAGGRHCREITDILEKNFNYKTLISVGAVDQKDFRATLSAQVWNFLKKEPKKGGKPIIHTVDADYLKETYEFFNKSNSSPQEASQVIQAGQKAYLDMINMIAEKTLQTPLFKAINRKNIPLVEFLLKHGAYANVVDFQGYTPLYQAIITSSPEIVTLLLKFGADPLKQIITKTFRKYPLELARDYENAAIINLLEQAVEKKEGKAEYWQQKKKFLKDIEPEMPKFYE